MGFHTARAPRSHTDDPDQGDERHGNEKDRQHNAHDGGLLSSTVTRGTASGDHEHVEQSDDRENDHDPEELVGEQGMLQDQIAHGVSGLDGESRLERETALLGDIRRAGGADDGDGQWPARPRPRLGKCEEECQKCSQRDADDDGMDHQWVERKVSRLSNTGSPHGDGERRADGRTPAYTVTRLGRRNGSIARTDRLPRLGHGCPCGTQVGNEPSERRAPVIAGCS